MFNILSKINTLPAIVSALVSITLKDLLYRLVHKKLRKMNKYINRKHFREAKLQSHMERPVTFSAQELGELRLDRISAGGCDPIHEQMTRQHAQKRRREDITK